MPILRELLTVLGFDFDDKGYKEAESKYNKLKNAAMAVVGASIAASAALFAVAKSSARAGADASMLSTRLGVSVENLQSLELAAQSLLAPADAATGALKSIAAAIEEARYSGGGAAEGFWRLGIRTSDVNGKARSSIAVFRDLADKIARTKDPGLRAALAMRLLGEQGAQLMPLLMKGSAGVDEIMAQMSRMPGVMSTAQAAMGLEQTRAMAELWIVLRTRVQQLGVALAPVLGDLIKTTKDWLNANRDLVDRGISALVSIAGVLASIFTGLVIPALTLTGRVLVTLVEFIRENSEALKVLGIIIGVIVAPGLAILLAGAVMKALGPLIMLLKIIRLLIAAQGLAGLSTLISSMGLLGRVLHGIVWPWLAVMRFVQALTLLKIVVAGKALLAGIAALSKALLLLLLRMLAVVAVPAMIAIAITAIALAIEDVYYWASEGESAIGNLYKAFVAEGVPPDAHWIVKALAAVIKWVHDALTAVDEFFEGFFAEASDLGGIWEATKSALVNAAAFWRHEIARFIEWLSEKFLNLPTPVRVIFGGLTGGLSELAARFGSQARSNLGIDQFGTRTPTTGPLGFLNSQLGSSPTTSPIPIRRESRSVSIQAPINLTVEAPPGADPQKVAEVTAAEIDKRMREREDEAYRQVFDEVAPRTRY